MQKIQRLTFIVDELLQKPKRTAFVNIAVGELAISNEDEIHEQWIKLVNNTALATTQLKIRLIQAEQQCMVCFEKYHPLHKETSCPHCGSVGAKILTGEEFYLESIEEE
jgi:Zn finger protein HypA/HybF involved in hydrogenase expression